MTRYIILKPKNNKMGKRAKEHRKKVQARNARIQQQRKQVDKLRQQFFMELIKQEQEKGLFNDNPTIPPIVEGPQIDTTNIEGPQL